MANVTYSSTPYEVGGVSGEELNASGDNLTVVESALTHPSHTDGFVDAGDPVVAGAIAGVASASATASTDPINVATQGIYRMTVTPQDANGNKTLALGDRLYINEDTAVVSAINTGRPFAIALAALTGSATPAVIPILLLGHQMPDIVVVSTTFDAANVAKSFFVADRNYTLLEAREVHDTKAGQAGTIQLESCATTVAAGSGTEMLATALDAAANNVTPQIKDALTTSAGELDAGEVLRCKTASGGLTSLAGCTVTAILIPR